MNLPGTGDEHWEVRLKDLKKFLKKNRGKWPVTHGAKDPAEKSLDQWCKHQKFLNGRGRLSSYRVNKLKEIGFSFETIWVKWEQQFNELKVYIQKNNELPDYYHPLTKWIKRQAKRYGALSSAEKKLFDSINFGRLVKESKVEEKKWKLMLAEIKEFKKLHSRFPTRGENPTVNLWLAAQRMRWKEGKITPGKMKQLHEAGIDIMEGTFKEKWQDNFNELKEFIEKNKRWPSLLYPEEKKLFTWCTKQRSKYAGKKGSGTPLTPSQIKQLESIGFVFKKIHAYMLRPSKVI